ncbi:hypothetical protein BD324DRAFT_617647 [Kockovaella imperatae]|uniref:Uncharacterized protein n=1 Tax=Kockovaella imperatae TaxID=4999 RepID=A0A1Y1ULF0_9TREE|nr:hypothetical protein BD324DRAFT_617647 [Kockovaella imperatae]ORX38873.1 hypothetical protein BD324DRAFT_617647 [Kockovaella imperatae]
MPLHPVPIIIGTTLAVIGGGYAFKKFVYDPHLAPFIEAFLATHQTSQRQAVPVPAQSRTAAATTASSSARKDRGSELRRRRTRSNESHELDPLLVPSYPSRSEDPSHLPLEYELREQRSNDPLRIKESESWGRPSSYELQESGKLDSAEQQPSAIDENVYRRTRAVSKRKLSDPEVPCLIQLESPTREVVFSAPVLESQTQDIANDPFESQPPSPSHHNAASPCNPRGATDPSHATTRNDLSHSITSLDSTTAQWANVRSASPSRPLDEDVISLPETSTSGYEDAETYSPLSGSPRPARLRLSTISDEPTPQQQMPIPFDVGLVSVSTEHRRGPMSVVSLSESEGWGGESDWAAGSEAGL